MIRVEGMTAVLEGSEAVLKKELAYLLGVFRSRILSTGREEATAISIIEEAVSDARNIPLDELRSDSRMTAEAARLSGK